MLLSKENQKKRGAFCFLCGHIDDKENAGETFGRFDVTEKRLYDWQNVILKPGLKIGRTTAICGRHFDVDDIIKGKEIGGQFFPYKRWRLKDGAVPKHLLGLLFCYFTIGLRLNDFVFDLGQLGGNHPAKSITNSTNKGNLPKKFIIINIKFYFYYRWDTKTESFC